MDDQAEFLRLFLQYQTDLRAFIGSVVRERSVRDDVLQETALVLWREFHRFDHRRSFGAWARGIAARKLLQRLDRGGFRSVSLPAEAVPAVLMAFDHADGPVDVRRDALERCLQKLPEKSRELLVWRYDQARSLTQVAELAGSTFDAVHKALSRIRERLRECIERQLRAAEDG